MDEKLNFHVQFHITNRCNLNCRHCYEASKSLTESVNWSLDEFKNAIEKLWQCFAKWDMKGEISLIGGEPTLCPDFEKMVDYLGKRGDVANISILTNGVCLNDKIISVIKNNHCHVQFSLDGINREKHDYIRGKGNYDRTISNIHYLKKHGIIPSIHYVLSNNTCPLEESFFEDLVTYGIKQLTFSRIVPWGNAVKSDMLSIENTKAAFDFIEQMRAKYQSKGLNIGHTRPLWCNYGYEGRCPVAIQTITIVENGDIMPCRRLPIVIGNIKRDNFYKVWYLNPVLNDLRGRNNIRKCGTCSKLDVCGGARCIAYATYGDYMREDPQCWI